MGSLACCRIKYKHLARTAQTSAKHLIRKIIMTPPFIGGGIKRCFCLTSVCRLSVVWLSIAYIGPKSRTERLRKTKIGTEVAHVTRGQHFQGQNVKGQLVADVLNSQYARTGATWRINTKILSTCRGRRRIVSPRAQLVTRRLHLR